MTTATDEPAVLTWMIAVARHRPGPAPRRHWWRELITDAWRTADHAWWLKREAEAVGYKTEQREFAEHTPRPKLGDFMVHMSSGRWAPERASMVAGNESARCDRDDHALCWATDCGCPCHHDRPGDG